MIGHGGAQEDADYRPIEVTPDLVMRSVGIDNNMSPTEQDARLREAIDQGELTEQDLAVLEANGMLPDQ
jgi:hypothetical protein